MKRFKNINAEIAFVKNEINFTSDPEVRDRLEKILDDLYEDQMLEEG